MRIVIESPWLKHPRVWWTIFVVGMFASVLMWVSNRDVPSVFGQQYTIPEVVAGGTVKLVVPITRQLNRGCSIDTDRSFIDSSGASENILENQHASAETLAKREAESPGYLTINVRIPDHAPEGPARIRTENQYLCPWNPTTYFWRIDHTWDYKVFVKAKP